MTTRNYTRERLLEKPARRKARAQRNKARRMLIKAGKVRKGDGKDVDHKRPLRSGGKTTKSNIRVRSASKNRAANGGKGGRPKTPKRVPKSSKGLKR